MQEPRADHQSIRMAGTSPLVLVVDDLPVMRTLIGRYLSHLGFGMVPAANAEEAMAALRTRSPTHALLDVHFPGGSRAVFDSIRGRTDDLRQRTVFMTGGFVDPEMEAFVEASGCPTIFKPFELVQLRDMLERAPEVQGAGSQTDPALSTSSTRFG